jgi:hypothetical protein
LSDVVVPSGSGIIGDGVSPSHLYTEKCIIQFRLINPVMDEEEHIEKKFAEYIGRTWSLGCEDMAEALQNSSNRPIDDTASDARACARDVFCPRPNGSLVDKFGLLIYNMD